MPFEHRKDVENIDKKVEPPKLETNSERKDLSAESGTQTDCVETVTVGTDTENLEDNYDKLEDILEAELSSVKKMS